MARPRTHDLDVLLDHARALWVQEGDAGVTVRALAGASGVSNGAIYHSFGTRDALLLRAWCREAEAFLDHQRHEVDAALAEPATDVAEAVVAAALAPASYAVHHEVGARLLLATVPERLVTEQVGEEDRRRALALRERVGDLVTDLADRLWQRRDRVATQLVRHCVVDLPGALLLNERGVRDPVAQHALRRAVLGVVRAAPPPAR